MIGSLQCVSVRRFAFASPGQPWGTKTTPSATRSSTGLSSRTTPICFDDNLVPVSDAV